MKLVGVQQIATPLGISTNRWASTSRGDTAGESPALCSDGRRW